MVNREGLLKQMRLLRSRGERLTGGQQQLLVVLSRKRNTPNGFCHCCTCCLEIMEQKGVHTCGKSSVYVRVAEPKDLPLVPYTLF